MSITTIDLKDRFPTWRTKANSIADGFGDLDDLPEGYDSIVDGVNYAFNTVGDVSQLETVDQDNIVDSLIEIKRRALIFALTLGTPLH